MHHEFLDRFAHLQSPVHRLDPRAKILGALAVVLGVVLAPFGEAWPETSLRFGGYLLVLLCLVLISRVPLRYLMMRSLIVIPFIGFLVVFVPFMKGGTVLFRLPLGLEVSREGLMRCAEILVKAYTCVLAVVLLTSTTPFSRVLQGLSGLRFPKALILILSFLYRYIFVLVDEVHRLRRALDSRTAGGRRRRRIRTLRSILGVLFLRTFERAERVYAAMLSRGFDGEIRTMTRLQWGGMDSAYLVLSFGVVAGLSLAGWRP